MKGDRTVYYDATEKSTDSTAPISKLVVNGSSEWKDGSQWTGSGGYFANQPDFHMNCINVRYWDRYWFGKRRSYGDLFPHYWSSLAGWGMIWFDRVFKNEDARKLAETNLTGNLCVYREDGFASNSYFYPYKVKQYSSKEHKPHPCLEHGIFYGKTYDAWANDQDWALYYALLLNE